MKTLKLALVATLVACALVNNASADGFKIKPAPVKVINLSIEKAMVVPGLVSAMYAQIDKKAILSNPSLVYVAEVSYNGTLYRISGTLAQWIQFYNLQGEPPVTQKGKVSGIN